MQDNILNAFSEQAKSMFTPMTKFNSLMVENMEKLTEFQINAVKGYAEMGLAQMKSAAEIKDLESAREFTASQAETATTLNKKVMEDAKALSEMAMDFKSQIESIVEEVRSTAAASAPAPKASKKSTAA